MKLSEIIRYCEQKRQVGDYLTLARAMNKTVDAVRMRLNRNDEETYRVLYAIIENRERIIKGIRTKESATIMA